MRMETQDDVSVDEVARPGTPLWDEFVEKLKDEMSFQCLLSDVGCVDDGDDADAPALPDDDFMTFPTSEWVLRGMGFGGRAARAAVILLAGRLHVCNDQSVLCLEHDRRAAMGRTRG